MAGIKIKFVYVVGNLLFILSAIFLFVLKIYQLFRWYLLLVVFLYTLMIFAGSVEGESLGSEALIYSVFEFINVLVDLPKLHAVIKENIQQLLYYVTIYAQMSTCQVCMAVTYSRLLLLQLWAQYNAESVLVSKVMLPLQCNLEVSLLSLSLHAANRYE